jgi:RHS repeat-associated protein
VAANANANPDTILVPSGTYTLTRSGSDNTAAYGDLDITQPLTIAGAGADTTILKLGSGLSDRLVHVLTTTVQISGLTIRNGNSASSGGGLYNQAGAVTLANSVVISNTAGGGNGGGGIHNTGVLTLTQTAVLSNTAASGKDGGGVSNGSGGTLVITGSVLSGNKAGDDGGGVYVNSGVLTMTNTTLSGNSADDNGGGLYNTNGATSWLINVTASNNTADGNADGTGDGGGLHRSTGTLNIKNTLSAGNADNSASTKHPDCSGTVTSQGYNLIQSTTGCTISGNTTGNITGQSANLGPLQNNGGPTLTHALLSGSPAINAGTNTGCPATDQRGYARDAACDIGAYEYGASGAAGGATRSVSAAPDTEKSSVQLTQFDAPSPRVVGDAPSALVRPLLSGPTGNEIWKVYYYAGAQLIAMRVLTGTTGNTLFYLHSDHLGSTSLVTNASGGEVARQYYYPYGDVRAGDDLPTDIGFTGQRADATGLMYFRARYYSGYLNRWLQPDSIVPEPGNPQALNRYSFVYNNPVKYTDPSGHDPYCSSRYAYRADCAQAAWENLQKDVRRSWSDFWSSVIPAGDQIQIQASFAVPFEPSQSYDDRVARSSPPGTRPLVSGTNYHVVGVSVVNDWSRHEAQAFWVSDDADYVRNRVGTVVKYPGPAEKYGESVMTPELTLVSASYGLIWGQDFQREGLKSYEGSTRVLQVSGVTLTFDTWQGVDKNGQPTQVGGLDIGISIGTPYSAGAVAERATRLFSPIRYPLWAWWFK